MNLAVSLQLLLHQNYQMEWVNLPSKSIISSEMDQILNSFSSTIRCHTVNGALVGLVTKYLAAHGHSQNRKYTSIKEKYGRRL